MQKSGELHMSKFHFCYTCFASLFFSPKIMERRVCILLRFHSKSLFLGILLCYAKFGCHLLHNSLMLLKSNSRIKVNNSKNIYMN